LVAATFSWDVRSGPCRKPDKLRRVIAEKLCAAHDETLCPFTLQSAEGGLELAWVAGIDGHQVDTNETRRRLQLLRLARGSERNPIGLARGTNSCRASSRFAATAISRTEIPVMLPPGRLRLATTPDSTGVSAHHKDDWNCPRFFLERKRSQHASADHCDDIDAPADQIGSKAPEPIRVIIRRTADLGGTVLPGSPADFGKLIAEETEKWGKVIRTANIKPD
jgi:hypothetical protein